MEIKFHLFNSLNLWQNSSTPTCCPQLEDLTTYGELAAEGTFRMWNAKGLRHVFLFEKMLLIAKKKEDNILVYKTHIMVRRVNCSYSFQN